MLAPFLPGVAPAQHRLDPEEADADEGKAEVHGAQMGEGRWCGQQEADSASALIQVGSQSEPTT